MLEHYYNFIASHLTGKQWKRHYKQIVFNLYCINKGYKPSFLWDIGPALDINTLQNLIQDLKQSSILHSFIYLVKIYDDIFVLNFLMISKLFDNLNIKIVNCSSDLDSPQLIDGEPYEKANTMINFLKDKLLDHFKSHKEEKIHPGLFLNMDCDNIIQSPPTVFGVLLGYPVVYWVNNINDNCLSNIPLTVYKVQIANSDNLSNLNLYSFSAPTCLNLDVFVQDWIVGLERTAKDNFKLIINITINSCVQL